MTITTASQIVTPPLPLEDGVADVLEKARKGLRLTPDELADRAGITTHQWYELLNGTFSSELLEAAAFSLNLHWPSLNALAQNQWLMPAIEPIMGLAAFTTDLGYMTVNAYVVWDPESKQGITFDTGASCQPMLDWIQQHQLVIRQCSITHTHLDHVMDIDRLQDSTGVKGSGPAVENPLGMKPLYPGDGLVIGKLRIRVLDTAGHTPGGLSYWITGLQRPVVIVGDALFAGSMGGAAQAYPQALANLRQQIFTLTDDTIICPGHGPLTTVGHEKLWNPFFPEFKSR